MKLRFKSELCRHIPSGTGAFSHAATTIVKSPPACRLRPGQGRRPKDALPAPLVIAWKSS